MISIQIRAIAQFVIIFFAVWLCVAVRVNSPLISILFASATFIGFFLIMTRRLRASIQIEKASYLQNRFNEDIDICVFTVCFNENTTIMHTIDHYMSFPRNIEMVVYDNYSTDDTYDLLMEAKKRYGDRLTVQKLPKRDIFVHPKGLAREYAFNHVQTSIFVDIDADTRIEWEDFQRAISAMIGAGLDVIHLARRNDDKKILTYQLAEIDEWMQMGLKIMRLQPWVFSGSGYLIRKEIVKDFRYHPEAISDDHYLYKVVKEKTSKIAYFNTLFAHERAPQTMIAFIKQRINWLTHGIPYYLLHEWKAISLGTILFALTTVSFFIPSSIFFLVPLFLCSALLAMQIVINRLLLRESFLMKMIYTMLFLGITLFIFSGVYVYILFKVVFNINSISFRKNE